MRRTRPPRASARSRCRVRLDRSTAGRRRRQVQHRVGQPAQAAQRRRHRPGCPAAARHRPRAASAPRRRRRQRQHAPAAAQQLQHAQPTSPQPTISSVGMRKRRGAGGSWGEGGGHNPRQFTCRHPSPMSLTITCSPRTAASRSKRDEPILSAAIRQGIGLPYGCRDGACGSCKSRLLEGRVIHGAHQLQGAVGPPKRTPAGSCLLRRAADRLRGRSAQRARRRRVPGAEDAGAGAEPAAPPPDVMVLRLQLPANQNLQYRAGQYVEFILRDGARRSYSMANAAAQPGQPAGASNCTCATCRAASSPTTSSAR
jgi:ferredoxin